MSVSGMAVEVDLGQAVPNLNAAQPGFISNTATLPIVNTPPATGGIAVPNSPVGASTTANNFTSGFNYINTITSTREYLDIVINVDAPQQGVALISNVTSITSSFGGVPAAQIVVFRFQ